MLDVVESDKEIMMGLKILTRQGFVNISCTIVEVQEIGKT